MRASFDPRFGVGYGAPMLNLFLALLSLPAFANEVPKNSNEYRCATSQSDSRKVSAIIFEAFDASWNPLYSSAAVKDSAGKIDFAGFVSTSRKVEDRQVFVTWSAPEFNLVGTFIPSNPSRNFSGVMTLESGETIELYCTF